MNRFHVSHYGGCAVLSNKDTFFSDVKVQSIYLHDWKETRAGCCRACYHVPLFAHNSSMIKRSCHYTLTTFTPRNVAQERSSSLQFVQLCLKKMWTWLLVTSMVLHGDATTATIFSIKWRPRSIPGNWADV